MKNKIEEFNYVKSSVKQTTFLLFFVIYSLRSRIVSTYFALLDMSNRIWSSNTFEQVAVFGSTIGDLKYRAAFALPGIGIFVNPKDIANTELLRHEFGHILQAKIWGYKFFYGKIVPVSVTSASKANNNSDFIHQNTWTEWTANWFAYNYFNLPLDWNTKKYPIYPPENFHFGPYPTQSKAEFDLISIPKKPK